MGVSFSKEVIFDVRSFDADVSLSSLSTSSDNLERCFGFRGFSFVNYSA